MSLDGRSVPGARSGPAAHTVRQNGTGSCGRMVRYHAAKW